ncbi:unnamed protein product [Phytophthora fragariaefolia]|uniref:Unnamed protein product n=1 Tax=Phytophthora fragariaefolia TaxID=1490495 RepID=A0A9W6Y0C7_9STRA|nr:unnamed protein product [Phytophthora fragariaefolia]
MLRSGRYQRSGTSVDQIDTGTWPSDRHDYIQVQGWYQENGTSADQIDTGTGRYRAIRSTSDPDLDRYGAIISSTLSNSASSVGTIISAHRVPPRWYIQGLKSQRSG